jgi:hypothetical protein
MAAGSGRYVLTCVPVSSMGDVGTVDQAVCPPADGQYFRVQTTHAYLLDPAVASYVDVAIAPFDYVQAAGFWGASFVAVMALYVFSRCVGAVLEFVRRG